MEKQIDKNLRYRYLLRKLNEALDDGYDIQVIAYVYALIEDRFNSFLRYLKIETKSNKVKEKIKTLRQLSNKEPQINELIDDNYFDVVMSWINSRNKIMHGMAMITFDEQKVRRVATKGKLIVLKLNRISKKLKSLYNNL